MSMNAKGSKTRVGQDKSDIVAEIPAACGHEPAAVEFFEKHRWGDSPACPCCGSVEVYQMRDRKTGERQKNYRWRCRDCGKQYTVRTGTVMEESRIPLHNWAYAYWRACTSKKGVSALEIKRHTGLSYKSALFLMHRIRFAMAPTGNGPKLDGIVEVDETYVGGKPRHHTPHKAEGRKPVQRFKSKSAVVAAVSRESGQVRARVLPAVTVQNLRPMLAAHIEKSARLMTDEASVYPKVAPEYAGHDVVCHKRREYVRGGITTNTIEGFFSLLKRGVYGTYHNISKEHLQRYVDEFEFRYNTRKLEDGERTVAAIKGSEGKRLMYREPFLKKEV